MVCSSFWGAFDPAITVKNVLLAWEDYRLCTLGNAVSKTTNIPTAIFFYTLVGPFPSAILLISTVQAFTILKFAVLFALIIFSVYSALTLAHKPQTSKLLKQTLTKSGLFL